MFVYDLVDGVTGDRRERLTVVGTPGWARRPEPVSFSVDVRVRPDPQESPFGVLEGNPMVGLHRRIVPWRDVIVVSWQATDGSETAMAAGIVSTPLTVDEASGVLSIDTRCVRSLMDDRLILVKTLFPSTKYKVSFNNLTARGLASEMVQYALRDYRAIPDRGILDGPGFSLPIDLPGPIAGGLSKEFWGYSFTPVGEALDDLESEHSVVIDFRPYWTPARRLRWTLEVFTDTGRTELVIDLGSTDAITPQASLVQTITDASGAYTGVHQTGKGSEVDVIYTRRVDASPTIMARETLVARPDIETKDALGAQAQATYNDHRRISVQDRIGMRLDPHNTAWLQPTELHLGRTVQLSVAGSLTYGDTTLRRTLIGWRATGPHTLDLDVQPLAPDSGA